MPASILAARSPLAKVLFGKNHKTILPVIGFVLVLFLFWFGIPHHLKFNLM